MLVWRLGVDRGPRQAAVGAVQVGRLVPEVGEDEDGIYADDLGAGSD